MISISSFFDYGLSEQYQMQGKLHLQSQQKNRVAIPVCNCDTASKAADISEVSAI
jgi:hypothetical protein